jgi:hypothetical protein
MLKWMELTEKVEDSLFPSKSNSFVFNEETSGLLIIKALFVITKSVLLISQANVFARRIRGIY